MTRQQLIRTLVVSGMAAGGAFFAASWDNGFMEATRTAGAAFFTTGTSMLGYLGWDARKQ